MRKTSNRRKAKSQNALNSQNMKDLAGGISFAERVQNVLKIEKASISYHRQFLREQNDQSKIVKRRGIAQPPVVALEPQVKEQGQVEVNIDQEHVDVARKDDIFHASGSTSNEN